MEFTVKNYYVDQHQFCTCAIPGTDECYGAKNPTFGMVTSVVIKAKWIDVFLKVGGVITEQGNLWENYSHTPHKMINDLGFHHEPVKVQEAQEKMNELCYWQFYIRPMTEEKFNSGEGFELTQFNGRTSKFAK